VICTFYSYKGGVGRSMAMANIADLLARRGLKVLMIDFDLEAPGLEKFFQIEQESVRRHPGLLDLLLSYKRSMSVVGSEQSAFKDLDSFICPVYERLPGGGRLDLMPAGQRQGAEQLARYALNLRTFDWQDFYFNWEGELFFEWLRRSLTAGRYDVVLVDSRTGVTEMGGICGYQLPDVIVMMCAANHQNVEGTQNMVRDFRSPSVESLRRGRPLQIVVVPARIELRDPALLEPFFQRFDAAFAALTPPALQANDLTFRGLTVPYEPQYAFEERVVSDPAQAAERKRIGAAFEQLADTIALLADPGSALGRATQVRRAPAAQAPQAAPSASAPAETQYDPARRFAGYDVYLDCSSGDRDLVGGIVRHLQARGLQVFYEPNDLSSGADWDAVVERALFHSRTLAYCVGAKGLSEWRQRTLDVALRAQQRGLGLRIVPVMLPGSEPAMLADTALMQLHALDLRGGPTPAALEQLQRAVQPERREAAVQAEARAPFVGPNPYREEHSDLFFGREGTSDALRERVEASRFLALVGPSGAGKTSLVAAGLMPRLRAQSTPWHMVNLKPGEQPLARLDEALALAQQARGKSAGRLLLWVNKLEEVFTQCQDAAQRQAFLDRIARLPSDLGEQDCLLVVLRADFVERMDEHAAVAALIKEHRFDLEPMTPEELRRAIVGPAERVGVAFEPGLVERIAGDLESEPNALSLLQHLLGRLWEQRREGWLTNAAYDAAGGISGVLAMRAEEVYAALSPSRQSAMRTLLLRLVQVGRGGEETRRRMPVDAIRPVAAAHEPELAAAFDAALDALLKAGLLIATEEQGQRAVEPAHESLVRGWARFRDWLDEEREAIRWRQSLDANLAEWLKSGRKSAALLRGDALDEALRRYGAGKGEFSGEQIEFIRASRKSRSSRWIGLAVALIVLAGVGLAAWRSAVEASAARARAQNIERAATLRAEADTLAEQGVTAEAIAKYSEAISFDPDNAAAHFQRGLAFLRDNDPARAETDFLRAIELGGEAAVLAEYYIHLGYARTRQDRLQAALEDFGHAVAIDPGNRSAWLELGRAHEQLAGAGATAKDKALHTTAAVNAYDRAIRIDEQFAEAYFNRGVARERIGERPAAIADFERVTGLPSADPQMKQAAIARLTQLGATARPEAAPERRTRVAIQFSDADDETGVAELARSLLRAGFAVDRPQVADGPTQGFVRFYYPQDEKVAAEVRDRIQSQLAARGTVLRLGLRLTDAKQLAAEQPSSRPEIPRPGTVEVWLPSLSTPLRDIPIQQQRKAY